MSRDECEGGRVYADVPALHNVIPNLPSADLWRHGSYVVSSRLLQYVVMVEMASCHTRETLKGKKKTNGSDMIIT